MSSTSRLPFTRRFPSKVRLLSPPRGGGHARGHRALGPRRRIPMTVQAGDSSPGIAGGAKKQTTFHGTDPDNVAEATVCKSTPTGGLARTRQYRNGTLELVA